MIKPFTFLIGCTLIINLSSCTKEEAQQTKKSNLSISEETFIAQELWRMSQEKVVEETPSNRAFLNEIQALANDIDPLYEGVDEQPNYEAKYQKLRANVRQRVDLVIQKSDHQYNGSRGKTILSINSFLLASYYAYTRKFPEFMWTNLAIFSANEVRAGIVLGYQLKEILEINKLYLTINELAGVEVLQMLDDVTEILINGQQNVFIDIIALALLNEYGPENLKNEPWLSQEARNGYAYQQEAEIALANGEYAKYLDLQTLAAIEFGAHEQLHVLYTIWEEPAMQDFNDINLWLMSISNNQMALFADIFVGVNKFTELPKGWVIQFPRKYNDLTRGIDRVEIARNGFNTLNRMRKQDRWKNWIEDAQTRLGKSKGVYDIKAKL